MQSSQFKNYATVSLADFAPQVAYGVKSPSSGGVGETLDALIDAVIARGEPGNNDEGFTQRFEHCDEHGEYPVNMMGEDGGVRWYPDGCPHCRNRLATIGALGEMNIPRRFVECSFDSYRASTEDQKKVLEKARDYAENFNRYLDAGACLIMRGNPGTGKNHLATAIAKKLHSSRYSVVRVKASEYLDEYWARGFADRQGWLKKLSRVDLLIIDELGRSSESKAAIDAFFRIFDLRWEECKPTAVLTNLVTDDMKMVIGDAAYDRLRQGGGMLLNFDWGSLRGEL
ncbi:MAG: hypothetical protein CSB47_10465 [Proteobacteria bacterium]|nr:MAG: hypothetical protein CSB47_10465 [Pseudomonadota bacterium]